MKGIPVCRICLEPISNFICPDCIYRVIQQWVWKYRSDLIDSFKGFHKRFIEIVASEKTTFYVVCKKGYYHIVCYYDYTREAYVWLKEQSLSDKWMKEFLCVFSMGFRGMEKAGE